MNNPTVVFPERRKVVIEDRPVPAPGPGQMLVKAERTVISTGTELTILSGDFPPGSRWAAYGRLPFTAGYDHVGRVAAVGEGVDGSWVGKRVASYAPHALYALVAPEAARPVERAVSPDHACFFTLAEITMNGVRRGGVTWGESVAVFGLGLIGQLTVDFCRLAGARPVIGIERAEARLRRLPSAPGVAGIDATKEDVKARVEALTRGRLADAVFEATGDPAAIPAEFQALRRQGRLVVISSPRGPTPFDFHDLCNSPSFTIIGAHNSSHPRQPTPDNPWTQPRHAELFFDLVAEGVLDIERLISHRVPYTRAPEMYARLLEDRSPMMGVVLQWSE